MSEEWPIMTSDDVLKIMMENTNITRIKKLEDSFEKLNKKLDEILNFLEKYAAYEGYPPK